MPELTGPTLGKGFTALAQAIIQVAQQLRIMNQLSAIRARAEYEDSQLASMTKFRRIEAELFPALEEGQNRG